LNRLRGSGYNCHKISPGKLSKHERGLGAIYNPNDVNPYRLAQSDHKLLKIAAGVSTNYGIQRPIL